MVRRTEPHARAIGDLRAIDTRRAVRAKVRCCRAGGRGLTSGTPALGPAIGPRLLAPSYLKCSTYFHGGIKFCIMSGTRPEAGSFFLATTVGQSRLNRLYTCVAVEGCGGTSLPTIAEVDPASFFCAGHSVLAQRAR